MSTFKVSLEQIATSEPHPNADRLDLSTVEGMSFQFVTLRDQVKPGDWVIYYPIDSILPENIINRLGLTNLLAGPEKNRIKTVRLRGAISQGVIEPVKDEDDTAWISNEMKVRGYNITGCQGVTKWDPEPIQCQNGTLVPVGTIGLSKYDIEGADRYPEIIELLMDQPVQVTEKLEGCNCSVTINDENKTFVNQREHTIVPEDGKKHSFWEIAEASCLLKKLGWISYRRPITVYSEYIGPGMQGNIYGLKANRIPSYDIKVGEEFLSPQEVVFKLDELDLEQAPVIAHDVTLREWLAGRTVQEASNGLSLLNPKVKREGVVIRPMIEQRHPTLGRLIIKQRSPEYLAGSNL